MYRIVLCGCVCVWTECKGEIVALIAATTKCETIAHVVSVGTGNVLCSTYPVTLSTACRSTLSHTLTQSHLASTVAPDTSRNICIIVHSSCWRTRRQLARRKMIRSGNLCLKQVTATPQLNESWTRAVELEPDPDPVTLLSILVVGKPHDDPYNDFRWELLKCTEIHC